jgi:agmatinase
MIDPAARWQRMHGSVEKAPWAGLASFADLPYTEEPAELEGVDAAIVGAPFDELVSNRPGARFGPRAIRAATPTSAYHLEERIDWAEQLRVVDYGDAPVVPANAAASLGAVEATVAEVVQAGALPLVLGGDHSITEANVRACAAGEGAPIGLLHFDAHTDTAAEVHGEQRSHGTPMYRLVRDGLVNPTRYAQIGLRGWWPEEPVLAWQDEQGITSFFMHEIIESGVRSVMAEALGLLGPGPVFLTVDVDVLDPAFAPGTGTPEPGGMSSADLLWSCRAAAKELNLIGADIVETLPLTVGDRTALIANRAAAEILTGLAVRKRDARVLGL